MNRGEPETVDVLGCRVSRVGLAETLQAMERMLAGRGKHQVVCHTVHTVLSARGDRSLRSLYNSASLALPDGVPLVWASRILGRPVPGRVAGPDLLLAASRAAARRGYTFFLMGGASGVAVRLAQELCRRNPGLRIAGAFSPPFHERFSPAVNEAIIARINAANPDVLWVGLGSPKQDRWIAENLERLAVRVAVGVGAAFDMYGGRKRRAPRWMQSSGLEWLYRFLHEPRRLFHRYFLEAPPFLPLVVLQRLARRRAP